LSQYNYKGNVYPINLKAEEILGMKCYRDIRDVPDPVELAVIVLPASMTLEALKSSAERGIKAVIIISGGFREIGESGLALEEACMKIAKENDMRIIGPNCVGTMDMYSRLDTTFIKGMPEVGPIGFVSQSGAVCGGVVDLIIDKQIGFTHFASLGNEMDVSEADIIEYFGADPHVKVIAAYVESIQDGKRFMQVARQVSEKKPIVLLKAGRTEAGAKAVSSHTGSLAGSYVAYKAAFEQTGVIEVDNIKDLFNVAWALGCLELPKGKRTAIITNAGGPAALASDSLAANGFKLADISKDVQLALREKLNPSAQVSNPIDMLGGAEPEEYDACLQNLIYDENVDILLPILVPQSLVDPVAVSQTFVKNAKLTTKPLLACLMGERSIGDARAVLHQNHVPMYQFPEDPGAVLGAMQRYHDYLKRGKHKRVSFGDIDVNLVANQLRDYEHIESLGEADTRPILAAYGIAVIRGEFAKDADEAALKATEIGFPVVLKIVSEDILHKSDAGGIKLNLTTADEVKSAYKTMFDGVRQYMPEARLEGVLVEKMAPKGQEVIIGMRRDPTFGTLMMFGMGGIYVELIRDVSFKVAPLEPGDIISMIESTYAGRLLKGFRGSKPADMEAVVDVIGRLSQLALDHPGISEIEINPLLVMDQGQGAVALDSRVILSA
ncbi:MAG: acetate--CoA ligase family protein, partial [Chloroflexota bacterium]